ncbi:hypothetical protein L7F22_066004 [Adiantum nelumboides]|nr:hypothetical protein [Adiantum nelumboides]
MPNLGWSLYEDLIEKRLIPGCNKRSYRRPSPNHDRQNDCARRHQPRLLAAFSIIHDSGSTDIPVTPAPPVPQLGSDESRCFPKAPHPTHILKCPRCASSDTKFCYYNNYSLSQPRYFCKNCKRYWTAGGILRNVPVGGGLRKNKRFKLKLAAEAVAAAAAAHEDLASHQQLYEGKPPSPVQVTSPSAIGSSITSANSSIVIGVPANFSALPPAPSLLPSHELTATHLPRTSSGSDCSTIDYAGNENCGAASRGMGSTAPYQLQHYYDNGVSLCAVAQRQFNANFGASSCNEQYSRSLGAMSGYHADGYDAASCSQSFTGMEDDVVSNNNNGNGTTTDSFSMMGKGNQDASGNNAREEIISCSFHYDWQFVSDNLFNGDGPFHPTGGSWSDFTQFHDLIAEK